ncbi:methyltransferase domain-containing protein [Aromatoleum toluclasticum]|uniref:class I SAM-dependent methyltransferase n=1 Tax=Aromatoleum toluclasticum TaxID=92003 RepID=UPI001D180E47|nr:class I SAM-dependent methyltransferase [Aromatoleum toluclasticum]MCC4118737.1 methyltransferase domain-containing protein [Aromatoleum toluclasticum]
MNAPLASCVAAPSATAAPQPDFAAIKNRQQTTWASGDYAVIGVMLQIVGESLAEAADLRAGERVLDVAAGNGNATLAAARRFADVTSTDYVPELLKKGAARARAEGLPVRFQVADVEALPFADGEFDVVLSTFGAMFAPDHQRTASELARVVRHGGRIGLAAWTPEGFIGELFRVVGAHVPAPAGLRPPTRWGDESALVEFFGHQAADIRCTRRMFNFRYRSPQHWIDVFRRYYGPTHKAFAALDEAGQARFQADLTRLLESRNVGGPDSLVVPGEYLEVVITRH